MKLIFHALPILLFVAAAQPARAQDFAKQCADREATERVYHAHRIGTKGAFEETMSPAMIENLIKQDIQKEAVLRKVYGIEITPEIAAAEVRRIETTTRAPEILANIKSALGSDPDRFANALARPIIVERELRHCFQKDDKLHADRRLEAEQVRDKLLVKKSVDGLQDMTWQLTPRPADELPATQLALASPPQATGHSSAYRNEATVQFSKSLGSSGPDEPRVRNMYFGELDAELQTVLRAQLQKPGDVSAVIETPSSFRVFMAKEITPIKITASSFSIQKRSYEEWLASQPTVRL